MTDENHLHAQVVAELMYEAYSRDSGNKNYQGKPMPGWRELPPAIREHWIAAAKASQQYFFGKKEGLYQLVQYDLLSLEAGVEAEWEELKRHAVRRYHEDHPEVKEVFPRLTVEKRDDDLYLMYHFPDHTFVSMHIPAGKWKWPQR